MQVAGWSKTRHPKGVASSGLAFQETWSDRWGQQQGILGCRPTQKSGRAGIGILRSVFEGEDPLQLAIHRKEVWQGLEEGRRRGSQLACGWGQEEAQQRTKSRVRNLDTVPRGETGPL